MIVFAILMIAASLSMIKTNKKENIQNHATNKLQLIFYGFIIGVITGFLGAGGGFLIIPVLIFFANLKMKEAVGTSLLIIAINSSIGFVGDIINHVEINWLLLFGITFFASLGMIIGTLLAKKIDGKKLKPAFGWFVLVLGFYIIIKEMFL